LIILKPDYQKFSKFVERTEFYRKNCLNFFPLNCVHILLTTNFLRMNIFVAKLSSGTKSQDLEQLFSKFGEVISAKIVVDRETGFSKRYGFVEMADEQAAYEAIEKLNDTELDGSQIVVKMSVPKTDKRPGSGQRNSRSRDQE
jgi:RNA recognition motif-containing protein